MTGSWFDLAESFGFTDPKDQTIVWLLRAMWLLAFIQVQHLS